MSKSKNPIRVFEYEKLRYKNNSSFTKAHFDALVSFNEQHDNKYYNIIHQGIQFQNYVGVIQIGGLTIEILPKVDKNNSSENDKILWQNVLLHMLRICNKIKVDKISETALKRRSHSIIDIYFEMFANEVEGLIKQGLIKNYRTHKSNIKTLKGRMLFAQNIQKNLIHKERFYCESQTYDYNHLLHQIIKYALHIATPMVPTRILDQWKRLQTELDSIDLKIIKSSHLEKVKFNRKSQPYKKVIEIAKMLILNYSPNINAGKDHMLTLLFDMNLLWEEYIYRILARNASPDIQVMAQTQKRFWNYKIIKPDILIRHNNTPYILDTKWKMVESHKPSDNDLKQMFAYNLMYQSEKSMLLYPQINQQERDYGKFHYSPIYNRDENLEAENNCKLGFIDIISEGNIKSEKEIYTEILEKLEIDIET